MRAEKDFLGEVSIPQQALYGIQSWRARQNFPDRTPFPPEWFRAMGRVKQAYYIACQSFRDTLQQEGLHEKLSIKLPDTEVLTVMIQRAGEVAEGSFFDDFIVPGISGGAGTSINMNINEIIANSSLKQLGFDPGRYDRIDPYEDANIFQSTNDVVPSALKLAVMQQLRVLEQEVNLLRAGVENLERENRHVLRMGYTQMQAAVPTSWGKLFSTYSDALSRDWWRITRCQERIKVVNLGGSAVGTGLTVPRYIIMEVVQVLQRLTGLPITRAENLADATSNLDAFVEVHATLKSLAVNLEKISGDLRILASDLTGKPALKLPRKQVGSSIMPGKVNPVIPEFVISATGRIYSNDALISALAARGCLELNAYVPVIGMAMLESIHLLVSCCSTLHLNLINGLKIDTDLSINTLWRNPGVAAALIPLLGYHEASRLAQQMMANDWDIFRANAEIRLLEEEVLRRYLSPDRLLQLGYSIKDL